MRSLDEPTDITDKVRPRVKPSRLHDAPGLTEGDLLEMYYKMLLARALDERMWILNRQGKAPFVISCQGHEGIQVGSAFALRPREDVVLPYYRDLAVVLTVGMTPREVMLAVYARADDPSSGGRQMPAHYGHPGLQIISHSSPVGTQILHAAGIALAAKVRRQSIVAAAYFGEGTSSQGDFHEGLNFAAIHKLPVVFICENNGYAISVPLRKQMATPNVADRAVAYGIPGVTVDGTDVLASYRAMREAVDRARRGEGPTLIEGKVYRFTPHSSDDDDRRYRPEGEVAEARKHDPLVRFRLYLQEHNVLTDDLEAQIRQKIAWEVDDATEFAEQAPEPQADTALRHVYKE